MLKSFRQFNESYVIHFEESQEFQDVKSKHKLSNDVIKDYFTDLIDERGFEIKDINCGMDGSSITNKIQLRYHISVIKKVQNPITDRHLEVDNYLNFLEELVKDIKLTNECISRISGSEELNLKFNRISSVPFCGAANNSGDFEIRIVLAQDIETNDLNIARDKFEKNDSPVKQAYDKLVKILVKEGVKEAKMLIDIQNIEEEECIMFGFLTNDEIIVLADYHYNDPNVGLVIQDSEIIRAITHYQNGYCSEYL